jgi:hypothetical protein
MKNLPRYAMLMDEELHGMKVFQLERPYIISTVWDYKRDDEQVQDRIEDMVQERYPIAKVKGYSIFLTTYSSLEPCDDPQFQREVLNEMAEYFLQARIANKPGLYMKSEESGEVQERIERTGRIMRERRPRIKND